MTPSPSSAVAPGRSLPAVDWNSCIGQVVEGKFPLQQLLGSSENSAVFVTQPGQHLQRAVIKLLPSDDHTASLHLARWKEAARPSHPHLIGIYDAGRCQLAGRDMVYVLMEYAEENLAQILPQRPLNTAEAREVLETLLGCLEFLHGTGLVHGHIKPSNILAAREQLKISADRVIVSQREPLPITPYSAPEFPATIGPAADMWSVGMTLVEALTQRLPVRKAEGRAEPIVPAALPAPFGDIARRCLRLNPGDRPSVAQVREMLRPAAPVATPAPAPAASAPLPAIPVAEQPETSRNSLPWLAVGAIVLLLVIFAIWRFGGTALTPSREASPPQAPAPAQTAQQESTKPAPTQAPSTATEVSSSKGSVAHEVLPTVPASARHTITGHVKVRLRVTADAQGKVVSAKFDSPGPSQYFARLAMQSAQQWTFHAPVENGQATESHWQLLFEFGRNSTRAFASQPSR